VNSRRLSHQTPHNRGAISISSTTWTLETAFDLVCFVFMNSPEIFSTRVLVVSTAEAGTNTNEHEQPTQFDFNASANELHS
jgi:hypothetical protein